jgi:hypothetical protein
MDFNHHYRWCLTVSAKQADAGTQMRQEVLNTCKAETAPRSEPSSKSFCKQYSNRAIAQFQSGQEAGCQNLKYPVWSMDFNHHHYRWCLTVSAKQADAGTQMRQDVLNKCNAATAPSSEPSTKAEGGKETAVSKTGSSPVALARAGKVGLFKRNWETLSVQKIGEINAKLTSTQQKHRQQKTLKLTNKFNKTTHIDATYDREIDNLIDAFKKKREVDTSQIQSQIIYDIRGMPNTKILETDGYVLIAGKGFGKTAGGVRLEYYEERTETEIFNNKPKKRHVINLEPYKRIVSRRAPPPGWGTSWTDNLIVAKLPHTFPGKRLYHGEEGREATLEIQGGGANGFSVKRPVRFRPAFPNVARVETESGLIEFGGRVIDKQWWHSERERFFIIGKRVGGTLHHWVQSGDNIYIYGSGFGNTPGKIGLKLGEPISGKWDVVLTQGEANWWRNDRIHVKAENIPGNYKMRSGSLYIQNDKGREWLNDGYAFGPRTAVKVVSGLKWFEFDRQESKDFKQPTKNGEVLLVSHDPGCGVGEDGTDWFFRNRKLPENVELIAFNFKQLEPDNLDSDIQQLGTIFGDLGVEFIKSGFLGVGKKIATLNLKMLFEGIFGGGGYYAHVSRRPNDYITTVGIRWANMCAGQYEDVPIVYLTSFTIAGPETVLKGLW